MTDSAIPQCAAVLRLEDGGSIQCGRPAQHGFAHVADLRGYEENGTAHVVAVEW